MKNENKNLNFTEDLFIFISEIGENIFPYPQLNKEYWDIIKQKTTKNNEAKKKRQKYYSALNRLIKYNFIQKQTKGNQTYLKITNKGLIKIQKIRWKVNKKRNKLAQGKYCIVVFDVPEKERRIRDVFRQALYEFGFERFQKSVFISEYDFVKDIKELIKNCELKDNVHFFIGEKIV